MGKFLCSFFKGLSLRYRIISENLVLLGSVYSLVGLIHPLLLRELTVERLSWASSCVPQRSPVFSMTTSRSPLFRKRSFASLVCTWWCTRSRMNTSTGFISHSSRPTFLDVSLISFSDTTVSLPASSGVVIKSDNLLSQRPMLLTKLTILWSPWDPSSFDWLGAISAILPQALTSTCFPTDFFKVSNAFVIDSNWALKKTVYKLFQSFQARHQRYSAALVWRQRYRLCPHLPSQEASKCSCKNVFFVPEKPRRRYHQRFIKNVSVVAYQFNISGLLTAKSGALDHRVLQPIFSIMIDEKHDFHLTARSTCPSKVICWKTRAGNLYDCTRDNSKNTFTAE